MATINKSATYEFGDFRVETSSFRLLKAGQPVALEPKALELLIFLIENNNQMLGKTDILNAVWGDAFVTENALSREIALLRKALGDDSKQPKYIETVQGRGYRFIAPVKEPATNKDAGTGPDSSPDVQQVSHTGPAPSRRLKRAALWVTACVALLAFAGLVFWWQSATSNSVRRKSQVTFSAGLDIYPTFSPDGNSLAYCSDSSGKFEIYVRQLAPGGTELAVTADGGQNVAPAWSPNGQWLAYHSKIKGGIWLVSALGGQPRRLTDFGARPAWSPDGSHIAFQSADSGAPAAMEFGASPDSTIWTVAVTDGTLKQLTRPDKPIQYGPIGHSGPQWSPEGKRIIFTNADGIWSVDPSGGGVFPVLINIFAYDAIYSPDGRTIFFASGDGEGPGIWMMRMDPESGTALGKGRKLHNLGNETAHHLAISPDGHHLLFSAIATFDNLYSVALDASGNAAGKPVALTRDTRLRKSNPAISPDGKTVAFTVIQPAMPTQVWTMNDDGKNPQQMSPSGGFHPDWLPTGDLTWMAPQSRDRIEILARDHSSGAVHKIAEGPADMNFAHLSPDGTQVAYQTGSGGFINVWTARLSDGIPKQLTAEKHSVGWPCWSPDGKLLAVEERLEEDTRIGIMPSEGGPIRPLTTTPGQNWPYSWSPDGDRIAFAGFHDGQWNIYSISQTTRQETQLTHFSQPGIYVRYPAWSPAGRKIVFEYGESTSNIWQLDLQ
jgi:Tol biopolymer transport system component/DNA-binding winged helix-turn-helix (wHTH) protein